MSAVAGEHNLDKCWSSDTGHYRPLLIHHRFGSYRATDGQGCSVGRWQFDREYITNICSIVHDNVIIRTPSDLTLT